MHKKRWNFGLLNEYTFIFNTTNTESILMVDKKLEKILIIDDDEVANFIYRKVIQNSDITHEIGTFQSAMDALNYIQQCAQGKAKTPEIIFLDINMPVMSGWDFLNAYKEVASDLKNQIKVYMLSSSVYQEDIEKAKAFEEVNDYIIKPLTKEKLIEIRASISN